MKENSMGREVRRVPRDWQHPKDRGKFIPLKDGYESDLSEFERHIASMGIGKAIDYWGGGPQSCDYMHPEGERDGWQMYEDVSEGTPISPVFNTPEELARWLANAGASAFAGMTATYEQWLAMIVGSGSAISALIIPGVGLVSGVEAQSRDLLSAPRDE
jgi:hypothetical protein